MRIAFSPVKKTLDKLGSHWGNIEQMCVYRRVSSKPVLQEYLRGR
jgi:hypothetical protein